MSNEPVGVDARHLGRLAAEQRAAGGVAGLRHPADHLGDEVGVELARRHVVEEEQRPGGLHEHVADAVVDDVVAEPANPPERRGQLDLRADAVGGGDEDGVVHRRDRLGREGAAEAADAADDLGTVGPLDGVAHLLDGPVALDDVDAGRGVRRQAPPQGPANRCPGGTACRRS